MNDRILSLLGLCRRAGKLVIGADPCIDSMAKSKAKLILYANDFETPSSSATCSTFIKFVSKLFISFLKFKRVVFSVLSILFCLVIFIILSIIYFVNRFLHFFI